MIPSGDAMSRAKDAYEESNDAKRKTKKELKKADVALRKVLRDGDPILELIKERDRWV